MTDWTPGPAAPATGWTQQADPGQPGTLVRTTAGLLARHEYDNATFPFVLGHWTPHTGVSLSLVGGALRVTIALAGVVRSILYGNHAAASKLFVQAVLRGVQLTASNLQMGVAAHVDEAAINNHVNNRLTIQRPPNDILALQEFADGATVGSITGAIAARALATDYRLSLFVDDTDYEGYEHLADLLLLLSGTRAIGKSGLVINSGGGQPGVFDVRRYFVMRDRILTASGIPAGGGARLLNNVGGTVAEEVAVAGTATFDQQQLTLPTAAVAIAVVDDNGDVLSGGELTPANPVGVWPGDVYTYTPPTGSSWAAGPGRPATDWSPGP